MTARTATTLECDGTAAAQRLLARPYVGFEETAVPGEWLMPPAASVTLIVNAAEAFGGLPGAFAAGLDDKAARVPRGGTMQCVDIKLTPPGAYAALGTRLDALSGQTVDVEDLFGASGRRLSERVRSASTWPERFALVDAFLAQRAEEGKVASPEVHEAWRRLVASNGSLPIGQLAEDLGWSRRHLIAKCKEQLGLPPKALARVLRFGHLLRALNSAPVDWARLAAEHGYYDQSHLSRDFRQLVGTSPTAYLAARSHDGSVIRNAG